MRLDGDTAAALRAIRMMHLLERLAVAFNRADVPVMVLKGAALNLTVYDRPGQRPMLDVDLLVRAEDLDRATAVLEENQCLRSQVLLREDFFPRFYYEIEYTSGDVEPVTIDLHVRPFRPLRYSQFVPADALWSRAQTVPMGQATVLVPCAQDMLIHLAAHAAIHGNSRTSWLADIHRWIDAHRDRIDWDRLVSTVKTWRLVRPVRSALAATEGQFGRLCPDAVRDQLQQARTNWRDWLALWQAPRDNDHPIAHVLVNVLCTPGWRFALSYLRAVVVPGRSHMEEWYGRRHLGWLPWAHVLRYLWPALRRVPWLWSWLTKIEVRKSAIHGNGVFATRHISAGEVIARYRTRPVDRHSPYIISKTEHDGQTQWHAITGKLRFLNHCCRPNGQIQDFKLIALRAIRPGHEITIDYGPDACDCRRQAPTAPDPRHDRMITTEECEPTNAHSDT